MSIFVIKDNETDDIINTVVVDNIDERIELEEMAEALGFYLEEGA